MSSANKKQRNPRKRTVNSQKRGLQNNQKQESAQDRPDTFPMHYAGPLRRLYAFMIDLGLLMMVIFTIAPVSGDAMFSRQAAVPDILFFFGYFVIPTTIWGRTPGKWVAGIVVVDSDGRTPGPAAIPREMIGKFIAYISAALGIVWLVFDPKRQGWHDKIAGTYVVDNPYSGGPQFIRDFLKLGEKSEGMTTKIDSESKEK